MPNQFLAREENMVLRSQSRVQLLLHRALLFTINVIMVLRSEKGLFKGASNENKTDISGDILILQPLTTSWLRCLLA